MVTAIEGLTVDPAVLFEDDEYMEVRAGKRAVKTVQKMKNKLMSYFK